MLIHSYFDLKSLIQIEINVYDYAIDVILCQLIFNSLSKWYAIIFFLKKYFEYKLSTKLIMINF